MNGRIFIVLGAVIFGISFVACSIYGYGSDLGIFIVKVVDPISGILFLYGCYKVGKERREIEYQENIKMQKRQKKENDKKQKMQKEQQQILKQILEQQKKQNSKQSTERNSSKSD